MRRRDWLVLFCGLLIAGCRRRPDPITAELSVWKSRTCGCCALWVDHMRVNGFNVRVTDVDDVTEFRVKAGVPDSLRSCHTATIDGYAVEGHIPADVVRNLLAQRPPVRGIAVPGMPIGSPGMEGARKERYNVLAFDEMGATSVFATR